MRSVLIPGVALKRAFVNGSELSAVTIRAVLLADIAADLFQLKPDGRNGIAPGPEMLAREIPFLAAQPGNRNGALPFEKPDHRSHRVLGGNGDAHVHMVRHQMPFENLAFLLPRQPMENLSQMSACLTEDGFPPPFGHEYNERSEEHTSELQSHSDLVCRLLLENNNY